MVFPTGLEGTYSVLKTMLRDRLNPRILKLPEDRTGIVDGCK
jgi:hypothetical protein